MGKFSRKQELLIQQQESSFIFNFENELTLLRIAIRKFEILSHPYE